jgi:hypothetical protein
MIIDLTEDTNLYLGSTSRKRSFPDQNENEIDHQAKSTVQTPPNQFTTRTGKKYYKIGKIVSITGSTIPNLREEIPEKKRIRKYLADLEFPCVNADYLRDTFGYELITEEVLMQRMKLWKEFHRSIESSYYSAYDDDEQRTIESNLSAWRNHLCELNRDFRVDSHVKKLAYQGKAS